MICQQPYHNYCCIQELKPGTKVLVENTKQKERNGEDLYIGSFIIHEVLGKGVYTLKTTDGIVRKTKFNIKRLKVVANDLFYCTTIFIGLCRTCIFE